MITEARLGDVCDIRSGGTPPRSDTSNYGGQIPWAKIADLDAPQGSITDTEEYITEKGLRAIRGRLFEPGTLLFAMYGSLGKTAVAGTTLSCNQAILGIRVRDEQCLDRRFLFYWLASQQKEFTKSARGVTQKNLSATYIRNLSLPLPTIGEQKRIAAILDAADALRAKRRETLAQLDTLLQSTFLEMFGDPVTNPKGWEVVRLADVVNRLDGGKNVAQSETPTDYRILRVSAVTSGEYRPDESKFLPEDIKVPASQLVRNGDLLISRANTTELIGATAYVWNTPERMVLPDKIWKFVWKQEANIEPLFVYFVSHTKEFRRLLGSRSSGTSGSMKNIAKSKLLGLPIPRPPRDLQRQFATIVQSVEEHKSRLRAHLDELDTLFASLQARAFSGAL